MPDPNADRENCFWLNDSVRAVMAILLIFSGSNYDEVRLEEIIERSGLPEEMCREILYTLAFDSFIVETSRGFNCHSNIKLGRLDDRSAEFLVGIWNDRYQAPLIYRERTGEWASPLAARL